MLSKFVKLTLTGGKYTRAPQTVHNTPVMNIVKGYFYIILFEKKCIKETK